MEPQKTFSNLMDLTMNNFKRLERENKKLVENQEKILKRTEFLLRNLWSEQLEFQHSEKNNHNYFVPFEEFLKSIDEPYTGSIIFNGDKEHDKAQTCPICAKSSKIFENRV